jgi:tetratricopeptide (TPR) repeat protein
MNEGRTRHSMKYGPSAVVLICLAASVIAGLDLRRRVEAASTQPKPAPYVGSASCRECHEEFYKLWAPSFHGLAMQPFTVELAKARLTPQTDAIVVGDVQYLAQFDDSGGWVTETGPDGEKRYAIEHALGGKNVYFFLTSLERGRLQTLPVSYDVRAQEWYDTAAAGVRHFADESITDEALHWTEWPYTFNTACYSCHVSQLSSNYDLETDTYETLWAEPGINCETCHGPGDEHIRVCRETPAGETPEDLKLIVTKRFDENQTNSMCAPCHAKMSPLTTTFKPGDRYFDHYDLMALENNDFYVDGRDLGENYTYTTWLMSPCVTSGELDCMHCHTSSGRYRFSAPEKSNEACMPCHEDRVKNAAQHTHHEAGGEGNICISCHMPMTVFARMWRSDHSMLPPTPASTIEFKSPNACNICHKDKDAPWADKHVREWRERDYQAPVLHRAGLVDAARKREWKRLPDMLAYMSRGDRDEITATSLIRLLQACNSDGKWPTLVKVLKDDPSPMVRASAAEALRGYLTPETVGALLEGTRDDVRIVRIRSAASLAAVPLDMLEEDARNDLGNALAEYEAAMKVRPDDFSSHYNLGNFHMDRRDLDLALASYMTSLKLEPRNISLLVNMSLLYNLKGQNDKAEESLRNALKIDAGNEAANLNLGMLLGETGRTRDAEIAFRTAFKTNPKSATAAYNLGVIVASRDVDEAVDFLMQARNLRPDDAKYGYTLAFYLLQKDDTDGAVWTLDQMVRQKVAFADAYAMLGQIHEKQGDIDKAMEVYRKAADNEKLTDQERYGFASRIQAMSR